MVETRTYSLTIEPHEEEGGYLAFFSALPGCHTWGSTYEQAVNNAEEALTGYLEALQKNGESIPIEDEYPHSVSLGIIVRTPVNV
jgi:predicted RNase H-like HicB family nuclease